MSECTIDGLRWIIRDETTDWNTVAACTQHDEYGINDLDLEGKLVFDIGAHIGGFTVKCASKGAQVVAVEPVPANVALIQENLSLNGLGGDVVLGAFGADRIWFGFEGAHGFIGNTWAPGTDAACEWADVPTVTLHDLMLPWGVPDVLKLDCEGGEWAALQETGIRECDLIVGEWHPTDGHKMVDVALALTGTHEVTFTGPVAGPGGFRAEKR